MMGRTLREMHNFVSIGEWLLLGMYQVGCRGVCPDFPCVPTRQAKHKYSSRPPPTFSNAEETLVKCLHGIYHLVSSDIRV